MLGDASSAQCSVCFASEQLFKVSLWFADLASHLALQGARVVRATLQQPPSPLRHTQHAMDIRACNKSFVSIATMGDLRCVSAGVKQRLTATSPVSPLRHSFSSSMLSSTDSMAKLRPGGANSSPPLHRSPTSFPSMEGQFFGLTASMWSSLGVHSHPCDMSLLAACCTS